MSKIHLICGAAPTESNPDGDEYLLCRIDAWSPNLTRDPKIVDCKRCIKRIRKTDVEVECAKDS